MNKLILCLSLLSFSVFSQDSYHSEEIQTCNSESCLVVDGQEIGFVTMVDQEGFESENLNTDSSLMDLNLSTDKTCFNGNVKVIKRMLYALSGNTNRNYFSNGGHVQVLDVSFSTQNSQMLNGVITSIDDYSTGNQKTEFSLAKCL